MFTVVIAEKEHIEKIREYRTFLQPFIDGKQVAFCPWFPEGETLTASTPHLVDYVDRHEEWRAIVLCGEEGLEQKNPFDIVPYHPPVKGPETAWDTDPERGSDGREALRAYLAQLRQAKFQAYEAAAEQPLTRLMTWLCQGPLVTRGKNNAAEDLEFAEYLAESARKEELRAQIMGEERLSISQPKEVICVAKRTYTQLERDIGAAWTPHEDIQYSRFYDWNLYFDKMRYLFFDILPKDHQNYEFDYIKFLYAVLILANHETPSGVLRPNRVFRMSCENDEGALRQLLGRYDAKLEKTGEMLSARIEELQSQERPRLSDRDAMHIFCGNINVPVTFSQEIDRTGLYAKPEKLGLATDCPEDEYSAWDQTYLNSRKTLHRLLKQPRRALRSAVTDLRRLNQVDLNQVWNLNEFQAEDVREHIDEEERNLVDTVTPEFYDMSRYDERLTEHCRTIHRKIETRMTRRTTVTLGLVALALYLAGFIPLLADNFATRENRLWALFLMGGAGAALAGVGFVCLLFLRGALRDLYRGFNAMMYGINRELDDSAAQFSQYLSHACNVMRGFGVLNHLEQNEDPDTARVRVLKKHLLDVRRVRAELREVFGAYLTEREEVSEQVEPYAYDFNRAVDFPYPIPYTPGMRCQIEFMQPGSTVQVPVNFVRRIWVRREELYD